MAEVKIWIDMKKVEKRWDLDEVKIWIVLKREEKMGFGRS